MEPPLVLNYRQLEEIFFGLGPLTRQVPAVFFANTSTLAMYSTGQLTGVVVDIGMYSVESYNGRSCDGSRLHLAILLVLSDIKNGPHIAFCRENSEIPLGYNVSTSVAVFDGDVVARTMHRLDVGGADLDSYLFKYEHA